MIVLAIDTDMRRGEIFKMCLQRKLKKKAGSRRFLSGCLLFLYSLRFYSRRLVFLLYAVKSVSVNSSTSDTLLLEGVKLCRANRGVMM